MSPLDATVPPPCGELLHWDAAPPADAHAVPLQCMLDLLSVADEGQAVGRLLELLRSAADAGPSLAAEVVLCGAVPRVRRRFCAAAGRAPAAPPPCQPDGLVTGPLHAPLVALARGEAGDAILVVRGTAPGPAPLSLLYSLAPGTAWVMQLGPPAGAEGLAGSDAARLARLASCAFLVREVHRAVGPAAATPAARVDAAQVRLGIRAAALSGRERQVCARIAGGHSAPSIAAELGIATSTVMTLRKRAYAKLGIHDRRDLCHLAA